MRGRVGKQKEGGVMGMCSKYIEKAVTSVVITLIWFMHYYPDCCGICPLD